MATRTANPFVKASKGDGWLKMLIAGPSGSGKTMTALKMADALRSDHRSANKRIAVVDTENGSAPLYSDIVDFDVLTVDEPYSYDRLIRAIDDAENAGYSCLVIDSATHFYKGPGGLLEFVQNTATSKYRGNSYAAWNDGTKLHQSLVQRIRGSKMHVIVTVRSKTKYVEVEGRKGVMEKMGMEIEQKEGFEYEFDIFGSLSIDHVLYIEKSRCSEMDKLYIKNPGAKEAQKFYDWLKGARTVDGIAVADSEAKLSDPAIKMIRALRGKGSTFSAEATGEAVTLIESALGVDRDSATRVADKVFDSSAWTTEAVEALKGYVADQRKVDLIRECTL